MKSNEQLWIEKSKHLHSHNEDAPPNTIGKKIIQKAYPIILAVLAAITTFILIRARKRFKIKAFIATEITGSLFGWGYNLCMIHHDPNYPGWLYPLNNIIGIEWLGMTLEDWLFYPICGAFFYAIRLFIPEFNVCNGKYTKLAFLTGLIAFAIVPMTVFAAAGRYATFFFYMPGVMLFAASEKKIDIGKMITCCIITLFVGESWGQLAVTIIPSIDGLSWASQWLYGAYSAAGHWIQSTAFLSRDVFPWAWIGNSPLEITWFCAAGGLFVYNVAEFYEQRFSYEEEKKNQQGNISS